MQEPGHQAQEGYGPLGEDRRNGADVVTERLEFARLTALQLTSTGVRISRRTLREAGVKGSDEELSTLAKTVTAELSDSAAPRLIPVARIPCVPGADPARRDTKVSVRIVPGLSSAVGTWIRLVPWDATIRRKLRSSPTRGAGAGRAGRLLLRGVQAVAILTDSEEPVLVNGPNQHCPAS